MTGRVGHETPSKATRCDFCREELTTVQEFIYHVESFNFADGPVALEIIRRMPTYQGEPLRLCGECRASIEGNARDMEDEATADARAEVLAWKLVLWLLVFPLGLLLALSAAVAILNRFR
jgi:hypothetical protein